MRLGLGIGINRQRGGGEAAPGPTNSVAPAVTGTAKVGSVLSVSNGTWSGNGTITYAYQWLRNGSNIASATANTYTLVSADDLTTVSCRVTATDLDGSRAAVSNGVAVTEVAPVNSVAPVVSGSSTLGAVLTTTNGTWTGNSISYSYQWQRNTVNISGQTANTYTIVQADDAASVRCVVTATNSGGAVSANSNAITVDDFAIPVITGVPTISGTTTEGQTLTASPASVAGNPTPTRTWQWRRDGVDISGATSITYLLVTADVGTVISVRQIETNHQGSDDATSANTATIAASGVYDPSVLFASSEAGFWAPVTTSRLWQDVARTTPVTTAGQTVASWALTTAGGGTVYAEQATAANRPQYQTSGLEEFLLFDGSNDCMTVSGLNLTASDEVTVIMGLRKLSSATGIIVEHGPEFDTNNGTFGFFVSNDGFAAHSRGTANSRGTQNTGATAPISVVASFIAKIATDSLDFRINKSSFTGAANDQGTGNYTSQTFNIGRRNSTSLACNMRVHGLIVRGALTSGTNLTDAEDWMDALVNP